MQIGPLMANTPAPAAPVAAPVEATPPASGKVKVAILLPLSGKNAALGQAMLNAAQQAVFDSAASNFELMPRDTGSNEQAAETSARDAVASGAQLLIGPLFATSVPAVRRVAQSANIGMLTLSTDTSLAAPGLYVMGFAPDAQVDRVVKYAAAHGAQRFAALVPSTPYGTLVGQEFQIAVAQAGGTVVLLDTFDAKHDSSIYVRDITAKRDIIQALFLPEGGPELAAIGAKLVAAGFDPRTMHPLGTGLWDGQNLAQQTTFALGGWYAASDPGMRRSFIATYTSTYGQEPPRLATLAYDATALAAVLAKRGGGFDRAALTNPNGFAGLDGIFRLTPQGLVERGLAVLEVTPEGAQVVDPAPTTFAGSSH
jgi:ABC-type branched-subunit amino acid transport system substrate-binding protein